MPDKGKVYIIGVGPGDYKLLTLRAAECISKSDVIVYDRLVSSKILGFSKQEAELVYVGKQPDFHAVPQEEINRIIAAKALEGKTVARVKGGDPFVFGRGGEEAEYLLEQGVDFEVVPGITSAIAVPAYAGIPVTHRNFCSSLHIITGHERPDKDNSSLDFEVLAKLKGTLVFLMGVKNLSNITESLIKNGKAEFTPAAVIEKGTTAEQRSVFGVLKDISEKVAEAGISSPAVTVIGDVAALGDKLKWLQKRKLSGKRIVVTRARQQASKLTERLEELGGEVIEFPVIKIAEPEDFSAFDNALASLQSYKWLVFTSVNGVDAFLNRMKYKKIDFRSMSGIKICAVGEATSDRLAEFGLFVDLVPDSFTTEDLLSELLKSVKNDEKVLLARADIANPILSRGLGENGIEFNEITVYRTLIESQEREEIIELLEKGSIDFITFTSSSTVTNFVSLIGKENLHKTNTAKIVCIGPVTSETANNAGLQVEAVADVYTINGLVDKLVEISEG